IGGNRTPAKFELVHSRGADAVLMNGRDPVEVQDAVAQAKPDAIVHQMTALGDSFDLKHFARTFAATNRLRTEGTRNLLAAAAATGIECFVAQSYTGWTNGEPVQSQLEAVAQMMTAGRGPSNAKAKHQLGCQPRWRTWREGFQHALDDEQAIAA